MKATILGLFITCLSGMLYASQETVPHTDESFEQYVSRVSIYLDKKKEWVNADNKILEKQAVMPYEIPAQPDCNVVTGLLMIHGLSDSPYVLKSMAQALSRKCVWIRGVLLPGHGTAAEDLLEVTRADWRKTVKVVADNFSKEVDDLYLVGFSTGGGLALDYAAHSDIQLAGLVLFSPLLKINSSLDWLASYLKYFKKWLDHNDTDDYAKYASIPVPAISEAYKLASEVRKALDAGKVSIPVFIALSEEDATLDSSVTVEFFQKTLLDSNSLLQLYTSDSKNSRLKFVDKRIEIIHSQRESLRVSSLSHLAVHVSPADKHYGIKGNYRACNWYLGKESFTSCKQDENNWYGEKGKQLSERSEHGARLTWNPFFDALVVKINEFIDSTQSN